MSTLFSGHFHSASHNTLSTYHPHVIEEEPPTPDPRTLTHKYDFDDIRQDSSQKAHKMETIQEFTEKKIDQDQIINEIIHHEHRSEYEAEMLYEHLKKLPFFEGFTTRNPNSNLEEEAFVKLCQLLKYEKHHAKKVLFKEGDTSNGKFYIVLTGTVYLVKKGNGIINLEDLSQFKNYAEAHENNSKSIVVDSKISLESSSDEDSEHTSQSRNTSFQRLDSRESSIKLSLKGKNAAQGNLNHIKTHARAVSSASLKFIETGRNRRNLLNVKPMNSESTDESNIKKTSMDDTGDNEKSHNHSQYSLTKLMIPLNEHEQKDSPRGSFIITSPSIGARTTRRSITMKSLAHDLMHANQQEDEIVMDTSGLNKYEAALLALRKGGLHKQGSQKRMIIQKKKQQPVVDSSPKSKAPQIPLKQLIAQHGMVRSKIQEKGFIEEKLLFTKHTSHRDASAITATECEFLVLHKRDFKAINEQYDLKRKNMLEFLAGVILEEGNMTTAEALDEALGCLVEKSYERDSNIIKEGETGADFYLIHEGSCAVTRTLKIDDLSKEKDTVSIQKMMRVNTVACNDVPLANIGRGQMFGEEVVFMKSKNYHLTVKVTSAQAKIFAINKDEFMKYFLVGTKAKMKDMFQTKRENYIEKINQFVKSKHPLMQIENNYAFKGESKLDLLACGPIKLVPTIEAKLNGALRTIAKPKALGSSHLRGSLTSRAVTESDYFRESASRDSVVRRVQGSISHRGTANQPETQKISDILADYKFNSPMKINLGVLAKDQMQSTKAQMEALSRTPTSLKYLPIPTHKIQRSQSQLRHTRKPNSYGGTALVTESYNNSSYNDSPGYPTNSNEDNYGLKLSSLFLNRDSISSYIGNEPLSTLTTKSSGTELPQIDSSPKKGVPLLDPSPKRSNPSSFKPLEVARSPSVRRSDHIFTLDSPNYRQNDNVLDFKISNLISEDHNRRFKLKNRVTEQPASPKVSTPNKDINIKFDGVLKKMLVKAQNKKEKRIRKGVKLLDLKGDHYQGKIPDNYDQNVMGSPLKSGTRSMPVSRIVGSISPGKLRNIMALDREVSFESTESTNFSPALKSDRESKRERERERSLKVQIRLQPEPEPEFELKEEDNRKGTISSLDDSKDDIFKLSSLTCKRENSVNSVSGFKNSSSIFKREADSQKELKLDNVQSLAASPVKRNSRDSSCGNKKQIRPFNLKVGIPTKMIPANRK